MSKKSKDRIALEAAITKLGHTPIEAREDHLIAGQLIVILGDDRLLSKPVLDHHPAFQTAYAIAAISSSRHKEKFQP